MATKTIEVRDVGESGDWLTVWNRPKFIAFDDVGTSEDWMAVGDVAVVGQMLDGTPVDDDALAVRLVAWLTLLDGDDLSGDVLSIPVEAAPQVLVAVVDTGESDDALFLSRVTTLVLTDTGLSDDVLNIGEADLPVVVGGVVNIVPNPSLELDARGWSADAVEVPRVTDDPWSGSYAGEVAVPSGAGTTEVVVSSLDFLPDLPFVPWVGSVAIEGDALDVRPFLRFVYDDASTDGAFTGMREWALTDDPSLVRLLDADQEPVVADGTILTSGTDRSLLGIDFESQPINDYPPSNAGPSYWTDLDVGPVYRFGAGDSSWDVYFQLDAFPELNAQPFSIVSLVKPYPVGAFFDWEDVWTSIAEGGTDMVALTRNGDGDWEILFSPPTTPVASINLGNNPDAEWQVVSAVIDGAASFGSLDGVVTAGALPASGATFNGGVTVGFDYRFSGNRFDGDMKVVAFFDSALSVADVQTIEGILAPRAGIVLPSGHPYETDEPTVVVGDPAPAMWARVQTATAFPDPAKGLRRIDLVVQVPQDGSARTLRLDGAQIEQAGSGGGASAYVDGDQGDGYGWHRGAHTSASYREADA